MRALFERRKTAKLVTALSALLASFSALPASAYVQLAANWPNVPPFCGGVALLCLYYAEPPLTVITIPAFLDPSLSDGTAVQESGIYNFVPAVEAAFTDYNVVPWWNPSFSSCTTPGCGWVNYRVGLLECNVAGATTRGLVGPAQQQPNGEWYALFPTTPGSRIVTFNSDVIWNDAINFVASLDMCFTSSARADGRYATTHETGHVSSLGHTGNSPAIMRPSPLLAPVTTYNTLQADDKAGLGVIYDGHSPSS